MKITKDTLKDMIAEEMEAALHEKATPGTRQPGRLKRDPDPFGIADEDEEEDFQRARELERATDAKTALEPKVKATSEPEAGPDPRSLPRRSMAQKSQDPALKAQGRAQDKRVRDEVTQLGRKAGLAGVSLGVGLQSLEAYSEDNWGSMGYIDPADRKVFTRAYNKAKKADTGSALGYQASGPFPDEDPAYLAAMRRARGIGDDQSIPLPQQSNVRESFNQKGKTKMKLTKNSLKRLIKEELDVVTESANARQTQAMGRGIQLAIDELQRGQKILSNPDVVKRGLSSIHGQKVLARLKAAISRIESATFDLEQAAGVSGQDPGTKYDRFPGASLVPDDMDLEVR